MPAAIEAYDAGAKVIILEKMPEGQEGGASHIFGGFIILKSDIKSVIGTTFGEMDEEYARMFSDALANEAEWIKQVLGLTLAPIPVDKDWNLLPMANGLTGATTFFAALKAEVSRREISVLYETPGRELIQDPVTKEILGVVAEHGGQQVTIKARKGVVICTGSYDHNLKMMNNFFYYAMYIASTNSPAATGDGLKMAIKAGANLRNMGNLGLEWSGFALRVPSEQYNSAIEFTPRNLSYIFVDREGKRFLNERISMAHQKGHYPVTDFYGEYSLSVAEYEYRYYYHMPFWVVFDQKLMQSGSLPGSNPFGSGWSTVHKVYEWSTDNSAELSKGWITKGDTIGELAMRMKGTDWHGEVSVDPAGLANTIEKFDKYCTTGADLDFGRAATDMMPLDTPPYYAAEMCPSTLYTIGGLEHNPKSQTLGWDGRPIPRLYSAGDVGHIGIIKPDGVCGAMAFGRVAGKQVAALEPWG